MILDSSFYSFAFLPLQWFCSPLSKSADGLSPIFFSQFFTDPAAHNYSQFCLIFQIKKIRLFVKEMYAAPLNWSRWRRQHRKAVYVRNNPKNQLKKMSPTTHRYPPHTHTHTDTLTSSVQISTTFMPKQILHQFTLLSSMKCLSIALIFSLFSPHKPLFGYGYVLYLLWIHYHWTKIQLWNRKTTLNLCVSISLLQFASCLVQIRYRNVF